VAQTTLQPPPEADSVRVLPSRTGRPRRSAERSRKRFAYALIAPAVAFMVLIHLLPTAGGVFLSFKRLNTFTFARLFDAPWAGLENYRAILFDSANPLRDGFFGAVQNTAVYTFWTVALTLCGGLAIALLLNRPMRGQRLVRTLMLTPWIVPSFVVAVLWQFMWQSDVGIVNKVLVDYLHLLGERPIWLLGENSMWAIVIPSVWRGIPFAMIFFLAGL
jgi:multiple sugar transport system permease protein